MSRFVSNRLYDFELCHTKSSLQNRGKQSPDRRFCPFPQPTIPLLDLPRSLPIRKIISATYVHRLRIIQKRIRLKIQREASSVKIRRAKRCDTRINNSHLRMKKPRIKGDLHSDLPQFFGIRDRHLLRRAIVRM